MGNGGGSGGLSAAEQQAQMDRQEAMMNRQMEAQQRYQREAEERFRIEREREKQDEYLRRQEMAATNEERQEAATFREMTGQSDQESSDFGGGFNLDMPTIERPGYESESRPL